jgi:hypothetical protein
MANVQVGGIVAIARAQADADVQVGGLVAVARVQADAKAQVGGLVVVVRAIQLIVPSTNSYAYII